jgi:hypothetical protein
LTAAHFLQRTDAGPVAARILSRGFNTSWRGGPGLATRAKEGCLVWRGQPGLLGASADGGTDAESLPQRAGGEQDTQFEHSLDLDRRTIRCIRTSAGVIAVIIEDAVNALDLRT